MIKVIAVDDEPLALRQLESYIAKVPFLKLVASCRSALEARAWQRRLWWCLLRHTRSMP